MPYEVHISKIFRKNRAEKPLGGFLFRSGCAKLLQYEEIGMSDF